MAKPKGQPGRQIGKRSPTAVRRGASLAAPARAIPTSEGREYPRHPRVGVGGVVIEGNRVLLVRRGQQPLEGQWSLPGGLVELGEELAAAAKREIKEETGLEVEPVRVLGVFERVVRAKTAPRPRRKVQYHYVIIDYLCRLRPRTGRRWGDPRPSTDVTEARWVAASELPKYKLADQARDLILSTFQLFDGSRRD